MANSVVAYGLTLTFDSSSPESFEVNNKVRTKGLTLIFDSSTPESFSQNDHIYSYGLALTFDSSTPESFNINDFVKNYGLSIIFEDVEYDDLSPDNPIYSQLEVTQLDSTINDDNSLLIKFDKPTDSARIGGEYLGPATGGVDEFYTNYLPDSLNYASHTEDLYEITGYDSTGLNTNIDGTAIRTTMILQLQSTSGAVVNDMIEISEDGYVEYAFIESVGVNDITIKTLLRRNYSSSASVKTVTNILKTKSIDYTFDETTGEIETISGQFTNGSKLAVAYTVNLSDLEDMELIRLDGDTPVNPKSIRKNVIDYPGAIILSSSISPSDSTFIDNLTNDKNGETYTYYMYAVDTSSNYSTATSNATETIPSIPKNLNHSINNDEVIITWDLLLESNVDGYNIYRCIGSWDSTNAVKINSILITTNSFKDGPSNITNRVSASVAPYPVPGQAYTYRIESEDSTTYWDIGTQNETSSTVEVDRATKTP